MRNSIRILLLCVVLLSVGACAARGKDGFDLGWRPNSSLDVPVTVAVEGLTCNVRDDRSYNVPVIRNGETKPLMHGLLQNEWARFHAEAHCCFRGDEHYVVRWSGTLGYDRDFTIDRVALERYGRGGSRNSEVCQEVRKGNLLRPRAG